MSIWCYVARGALWQSVLKGWTSRAAHLNTTSSVQVGFGYFGVKAAVAQWFLLVWFWFFITVLLVSEVILVSGKGLFSSSLRKFVQDHPHTLFIRWWPIFSSPSDISKSSSESKTACIPWKGVSAEPWAGGESAHGSCCQGAVCSGMENGDEQTAHVGALTAVCPVLGLGELDDVGCSQGPRGSSSACRSNFFLRAGPLQAAVSGKGCSPLPLARGLSRAVAAGGSEHGQSWAVGLRSFLLSQPCSGKSASFLR